MKSSCLPPALRSRGFLALVALLLLAATAPAATPPNLLVIYADDLGWGELGCQGGKDIPTPHIDSIARAGIRFTNGYVAATYCSPSRAGLLTGRYPTRFGHEFNSVANVTGLRLDQRTIADRLKELGYASATVGKWHLGGGPEYRPTRRGFDEFYGTLANTPFFQPRSFVDSRISDDVRPVTDPAFYTTDAYTDRAVDWLERNKGRRWFLYLPYNAQHAPLEAPAQYLARFPGITDPKRKLFAAMLASMDDGVGRVLAKVRALGQEENTLIFFIADNGGPTQSTTSSNGPLRGFKMTTYEGGPRVPFLAQWKGTWPAAGRRGPHALRHRAEVRTAARGALLALRPAVGGPAGGLQAGRLPRRQRAAGAVQSGRGPRRVPRPRRGTAREGAGAAGAVGPVERRAGPGERARRARDQDRQEEGREAEVGRPLPACAPGAGRGERGDDRPPPHCGPGRPHPESR